MRFAIKNFAGFDDWVEYDDATITVLAGPNSSGKSSLVRALSLLSAQDDIWRLSFASGAGGFASFAEAVHGRDPSTRIEVVIKTRIDAFASLLPLGRDGYESVDYATELRLAYSSDPFDEGTSGILTDLEIYAGPPADEGSGRGWGSGRGAGRSPVLGAGEDGAGTDSAAGLLFSILRKGGEYELFIDLGETLLLPFVFSRLPSEVGADAAGRDASKDFDRVLAALERLRGLAPGKRGKTVAELSRLVAEQKKALEVSEAFVRLLGSGRREEAAPEALLLRTERLRTGFKAREPKYLRSIADLFVRQAFVQNDLDWIASPTSLAPTRPSFEALYHEALAASRLGPSGRGSADAVETRRLIDAALGEYGAGVRDLINEAAFKREDGRTGLEEIDFRQGYREVIEDFGRGRAGRPAPSLVREGRGFAPRALDLEARRRELRTVLVEMGLGEDLALPPPGGEGWPIALLKGGRLEPLAGLGPGPRALVLVAARLLHAPWGARLVVEHPESGLHPRIQDRLADLYVRLKEACGASIVVETHSARLIRRFQALASEGRIEAGEVVLLLCGAGEGGRGVLRAELDPSGGLEPAIEAALLEAL